MDHITREIDRQPNLISNQIHCHCGKSSKESASWWAVQNWWREHGFGLKCG
jgi:hypothetical protein